MATKEPDAAQAFRSAVISAATDAVMKEMTAAEMRKFIEQLIASTLTDLTNENYGLKYQVKQAAENYMKEHLKTSEVQALIRAAVEKGVHDAMGTLSAETQGKVIDLALRGIANEVGRGR
jgi:hypothetical protein